MQYKKPNIISKLVKHIFIYGFSSVLARVLNYLLIPLHTRIFSPVDLGFVTEIYVYAALLNIIYTYGMENALFRFSIDKEDKQTFSNIFISVFITGLLFSITLFFLTSYISNYLDFENSSIYFRYIIIIVFIDSMSSILLSKLRLSSKSMKFARIQTVRILVNIIANVVLFYIYYRVSSTNKMFIYFSSISKLNIIFISNLLSSVICFILLIPDFIENFKLSVDFRYIREILKYSIPLLFASLSANINELISRPMIRYLLPDNFYPNKSSLEILGIFGSCYKLSIFINLSIQAFRYASEPYLFKYGKSKSTYYLLKDILYWFIIFVSIVFVLVGFNLDLIADIMLGYKFREAIEIVPYLMLSYIFIGVYYNISIWYKILTKTYFGIIFVVTAGVINIVLNIILIPIFGYWGAVYAILLSNFLMVISCFIIGKIYMDIHYDVFAAIKYILGAFILIIFWRKIGNKSVSFRYYMGIFNSLIFLIFMYYHKKEDIKSYLNR